MTYDEWKTRTPDNDMHTEHGTCECNSCRAHRDEQDAYFEACDLSTLAFKLWHNTWTDLHPYETVGVLQDDGTHIPVRCSIRTKQSDPTHVVETIKIGSELCGSWFQQSNGGERSWCAVAGEFEAR